MPEVMMKTDEKMDELLFEADSAMSTFSYESGYTLKGKDLGDRGVKLELFGEDEEGRAIILPPGKAQECGKWLLQTIGEEAHRLPRDLPEILQRLILQKGPSKRLKRGDKTKVQQAIRVLKILHGS